MIGQSMMNTNGGMRRTLKFPLICSEGSLGGRGRLSSTTAAIFLLIIILAASKAIELVPMASLVPSLSLLQPNEVPSISSMTCDIDPRSEFYSSSTLRLSPSPPWSLSIETFASIQRSALVTPLPLYSYLFGPL